MSEDATPRKLTRADVEQLMTDSSSVVRAETTAKIADEFSAGDLSLAERKIAEDIFRKLVKDVEVSVREALAVHLKACSDIPHDVAVSLARDIDAVALPVLRFSDVLTDEDLIEIIQTNSTTKQVAVAQRQRVSSKVADALIDTGNETAVARLVSNEGADITESSYERVMRDYGGSAVVSESMARAPSLPASVSAQLVEAISQRLQDYLLAKHELPPDVASGLIFQARERATMSLFDTGSSDEELDNLVDQLHRRRRISASLLLRALCLGDINFFERAIARLANVSLANVRVLIYDEGSLGFESLYLKAGLPQRLYPAFRAGIDLAKEADYDGGPNDRARYIERLIERMLTRFDEPGNRLSSEDISFLMEKLHQLAA